MDLTGADLKAIGAIARNIKQREPEANVYTILSLGSMTAGREIWHSGVLIDANDSHMRFHDPATRGGRAFRPVPKRTFLMHWAAAYNPVRK